MYFIVVVYPFFVLFLKVGRWMFSTIYNMRPSLKFRLRILAIYGATEKKKNKQINISRLVFFGFFNLTSNAIWKTEKRMLLWLILSYDRSFHSLAKLFVSNFTNDCLLIWCSYPIAGANLNICVVICHIFFSMAYVERLCANVRKIFIYF